MMQNKQIPAGYKDSPLGVIPAEWEVKRLGEFIESLETGVSVNSSEELNVLSEYGILKTSSVQKGKFYPFENKSIVKSEVDRAKCNPRKNCLIISRMNTPELVGECGYVGNDYETLFLPDRLWQTVFKKDSNLLPVFLNYVLNTDLYRLRVKEMATGTSNSMKNITKSDWLNLKISLPPLSEQQRIAEVLGTWDQGIELQAKLIESLQKRKRALMQQLLTGKKRLKGFDQAWKKVKLGEIGYTYNGLTGKSKEDFEKGDSNYIPYINIFNNGKIDLNNLGSVDLNKEEKQNKANFGDVFFTVSSETSNEIGMSSVLLANIDNLYLNSFCFGYRLYDFNSLIPEFAVYFFRAITFRKKMIVLAQGSTRYNISKTEVLKLLVDLPPLPEQQAIAEILTAADREIELAQKKLEVLREQKRGLMQQLLTGKKRLKV